MLSCIWSVGLTAVIRGFHPCDRSSTLLPTTLHLLFVLITSSFSVLCALLKSTHNIAPWRSGRLDWLITSRRGFKSRRCNKGMVMFTHCQKQHRSDLRKRSVLLLDVRKQVDDRVEVELR